MSVTNPEEPSEVRTRVALLAGGGRKRQSGAPPTPASLTVSARE